MSVNLSHIEIQYKTQTLSLRITYQVTSKTKNFDKNYNYTPENDFNTIKTSESIVNFVTFEYVILFS